FSDSVISFGSVYSGDAVSKPLVMTNTGNWTCTVVQASIVGADKALFSFTPSDSSFIVEPDSSRKFSISFHPGNKISFTWSAYFVVVYDDNTFDSVLLVGTELPPIMDVSQHVHNFGKVRIGAWRIDTVTSIYNPNNVDVTLTEQAVRPSTHFLFVSQVPPIPSHKTTALQAEFKPLIPGPLEAYYYINANASERDSILLEGIGAVAKAIFAPQQINFGVVKSNTPVTDSTILTDSGDYPLEIVWYEIKGPDASDFSVLFPPTPKASPQSPYILNEDSSITIKVRFFTNARTGEAHYATLCIHYSDSSSDCLPLEAIEETQYLQFGQSSVDFGKVRVNTSAQKTAMFRNGSGKTLQVDSLWLTSNSSVFALLSQLGPVAAGDSGKVSINFLPTARTQYNGELHGAKGDFKTDSIQVRGIGAAPMPTFAPQVVNFGTVPLLTTQPNSFELIDTGDWQLRVIHSELVGDTYNEFTYTKASGPDPTRDTVAEQGNSLYNVTFRPTQTIVYHTAKIVFTFDDSTQGYVQLVGYDESPFLVLDADSLNFGKVRIGTSKIDSANLVSTYIKPLTAAYLNLTNITNNGFTADKTGTNITVPANTLEPIHVTFTPTIIGAFTARLTMANADTLPHYDTTFITGIGAKPIPTFMMDSTLIDTLDFGAMFNGYSATRSIVLANNGNWDISTLSKKVIGVNATDFTPNFSQQVVVTPSSSKTLAITYQASTPYQAATRYGEIDFLLDDSSVFKLYLKAQDIAPINLDLKFDNEALRPGDIVYPNLRLLSAVPDSLKLNHLKGVIQWDPAVVSLIKVEPAVSAKGKLVLTPPATGSDIAGQYTYDLDGASNNFNITSPIALLRMTFQPAPAAQPGMQSPLQHAQFSLPKRTEFLIQEVGGILLIDSTCGDTHLTSGSYTANYIDMNTPNPFGGDASNEVTSIHYNIAQDGTDVLIRIIDITGREVMRPVDHARQKQGYYQLNISARDVPASGTYFYEFTAGADTPVVKKMLVRK
ncbi:MAG TPA: choice-of-anchor D domain-containing protein, partial [Candidatus Kapabacteria bacterium]|nr:choice-of-anchor D domain-containing protein [Candidatus Kapabacteria bacterium]